jgi:precorrin-4/cobalt-precorrin-4 C11-methyltransferase
MKQKVIVRNYLYLAALSLLILILSAALPASAQGANPGKGRLYLVGLGTGDRDNMTVRAQKTIAAADVVFAMKHVFKQYADMLQGKELHDAGHALYAKHTPNARPDSRAKSLEEKNRRIIRQAINAGKTVAVISGGDALLYGPHSAYLKEFQDLKPEVVPGLSCFNAANAALQRGITRGIVSHSVILTTSMNARRAYSGKDTLAKLAETQSTMVFFTMRSKLPEVIDQLKKGYPGDTPLAIVCHAGYRDKEKVILATVDTIIERLNGKDLPFEHLIYVGDFLK